MLYGQIKPGDSPSAAELADMKAFIGASMPFRATIKRPVVVADGMGGFDKSQTQDVATNVPAKVVLGKGHPLEERIAEKLNVLKTYRLLVPAGTDLKEYDRVQLGTSPQLYEVHGLMNELRESAVLLVAIITTLT